MKNSPKEELMNAITHGIGVCLAIAALVLLILAAALYGNTWHIVSFTIFGVTLVILYIASTLYHSITNPAIKDFFRKLDHISIFLLISGTYTPFCIAVLRGWVGWTLFGVVWTCSAVGIILKIFYTGRREFLSTILYVAMGWVIIIAIKPLYDMMSSSGFAFLLTGGICYTTGVFFFMNEKIRYNHSIWHMFVLAGSTFHFFSVISLL